MTEKIDLSMWANTKWRCGITGDELTIPSNVRPKQFFKFGESFIDIGDGYYSRMGGRPIYIEPDFDKGETRE